MNWVKSLVNKVRAPGEHARGGPGGRGGSSGSDRGAGMEQGGGSGSDGQGGDLGGTTASSQRYTSSSWPASPADLAAVFPTTSPDSPQARAAALLASSSATFAQALADAAGVSGPARFLSPQAAQLSKISLENLNALLMPLLELFAELYLDAPRLDGDLIDQLTVTLAPLPLFVAAAACSLRSSLVAAGRAASSRAAAASATAALLVARDGTSSHGPLLVSVLEFVLTAPLTPLPLLADAVARTALPTALAKALVLAVGCEQRLGPPARTLAALITASHAAVEDLLDSDTVFVLCKLPPLSPSLLPPLAAVFSPAFLSLPAAASYIADKGCYRVAFSALVDGLADLSPQLVLDTLLALLAPLFEPDLSPPARLSLLRAFECGPDVYLIKLLSYMEATGSPTQLDQLIGTIVDLLYIESGQAAQQSVAPTRSVSAPADRGAADLMLSPGSATKVVTYPRAFTLLDLILSIFAVDPGAYEACNGPNVLSSFLIPLPSYAPVVQNRLIKLVQFVATSIKPHPTPELTRLAHLLATLALDAPVVVLITAVFTSLVSFDSSYRDEARELGVVDALVALLDPAAQPWTAPTAAIDAVTGTLACLLESNYTNVRAVRAASLPATLMDLLVHDSLRPAALTLLVRIVGADKRQEHADLVHYIELLHVHSKTSHAMTVDMLNAITLMFRANPGATATFRDLGGFVTLVSILVALEGVFAPTKDTPSPTDAPAVDAHALVLAVLRLLYHAVVSQEQNLAFVSAHIGFKPLGQILLNTGFLDSTLAPYYVYLLVAMAMPRLTSSARPSHPVPLPFGSDAWDVLLARLLAGDSIAGLAADALVLNAPPPPGGYTLPLVFSANTRLAHPAFVLLALNLVFHGTHLVDSLLPHLSALLEALAAAAVHNAASLGSASLLSALLAHSGTWLESERLRPGILRLIQAVGRVALAPSELRALLNLYTAHGGSAAATLELTNTLLLLAEPYANDPPFVNFDLRHKPGFAGLHMPSLGSRSWPPATGYTFGTWLYVEALDASHLLRLLTVSSDDKRSYLALSLLGTTPLLSTSAADTAAATFAGAVIKSRRWYHLVVTHSRSRLHASVASLYIDGLLAGSHRCPYPASAASQVSALIGTSPSMRGSAESAAFKLGATYMIEAVASPRDVHLWYCLGPQYSGTFDPSLEPYQSYAPFDGPNLATATALDASDSSSAASDPSSAAAAAASAVAALASLAAARLAAPAAALATAIAPAGASPVDPSPAGRSFAFFEWASYLNYAAASFTTLTGPNIVFAFSAKSYLDLSSKVTTHAGADALVASSHLLNLASPAAAAPRSLIAPRSAAALALATEPFAPSGTGGAGRSSGPPGAGDPPALQAGTPLYYDLERAALASASAVSGDAASGSVGRLMGLAGAYTPTTLATALQSVGGVPVVLELVATATTRDELFARVQLLSQLLDAAPQNLAQMTALAGYEILAQVMVDKVRDNLVDHATLNALVALVGKDIVSQDHGLIASVAAFDALFANPCMWASAPVALQALLLSRLSYLVTFSSLAELNLSAFRASGVLIHVLEFMLAPETATSLLEPARALLRALLAADPREVDFSELAHYLVATLSATVETQGWVGASESARPRTDSGGSRPRRRRRARSFGAASARAFHEHVLDSPGIAAGLRVAPVVGNSEDKASRLVSIRNMLLTDVLDALAGPARGSSPQAASVAAEIFARRTTRQWVLFFLERNVHKSTVLLALRILGSLLLGEHASSFAREFRASDGFAALAHMLPHAASSFTAYFLLFAILLGRLDLVVNPPEGLDGCATDENGIFASGATPLQLLVDAFGVEEATVVHGDIVLVLLAMLKARCAAVLAAEASGGSESQTPAEAAASSSSVEVTMLKFMTFLFKASPSFRTLASKDDVICQLTEVLFPRAHIATSVVETSLLTPVREDSSLDEAVGSCDGGDDHDHDRDAGFVVIQPVENAESSPSRRPALPVRRSSISRSPSPTSPSVSVAVRRQGLAAPGSPSPRSVSDSGFRLPSTPVTPASPQSASRRKLQDFYGLSPSSSPSASAGAVESTVESSSSGESPSSSAQSQLVTLFLHPVSMLVFDFLRTLVQESFIHSSTGPELLERVLEAVPPYVGRDHHVLFQSKLLSDLMDYLAASLTVDKLVASPNLAAAAEAFYSLLVAKVYRKSFPGGSRLVFDFLVTLITKLGVSAAPASAALVAPLTSALSLIVIHDVYCAANGVGREPPLDVLNRLLLYQQTVFLPTNTSSEFYGCLCYWLYRFLLHDDSHLRLSAMNLWKLLILTRREHVGPFLASSPEADVYTGGFERLVRDKDFNGFSYWMAEHDSAVKAVFDVTLAPVWEAFERIQVRGQAAALRKANAARSAAQEARLRVKQATFAAMKKADMRRMNRVVGIQHVQAVRRRKRRLAIADRTKQVSILWRETRAELYRQRGLWEDARATALLKWKLDRTEGPHRIRLKMTPNPDFYARFPFLGEGQNSGDGGKIPTSRDSAAWAELMDAAEPAAVAVQAGAVGDAAGRGLDAVDGAADAADAQIAPIVLPVTRSGEFAPSHVGGSANGNAAERDDAIGEESGDGSGDDNDDEDDDDDDDTVLVGRNEGKWLGGDETLSEERTDRKILRLLEPGERMRYMYNCARIVGLDTWPALFLVCESAVYVIDYYMVLPSGDVEDVSGASVHEVDPALGPLAFSSEAAEKEGHAVVWWKYEDIANVLKRRYLLRDNALELFSVDGRNDLLMFDIAQRNEVVSKIKAKCSSSSRSPLEALGGLFSSSAVSWSLLSETGRPLRGSEGGGSSRRGLNKLFASSSSSVKARWVEGSISNFEYLMHLNTLAGRSYNDLTQYPVFPWILSDYVSETLDLSDPSVYRDLSKPMGAIGAERRAQFEERYAMWEDDMAPPFHYGTHYSSAGTVLHYLIRMEPFTSHFLKLQGGKFDHPDRLFASLRESWESASALNMSDVKELIPEFFYLPDFLANVNKFELGVRQDGVVISDVELPPWAHGSAREFVRIHRAALESDYVSAHLHEWIDLVFGYKQRGEAARDALNVFFHLTYEGAVDIAAIDDPVIKAATIAQINNFGQTPRQLFKKPHPARNMERVREASLQMTVFSAPHVLLPSSAPVRQLDSLVGLLRVVNDTLQVAPALHTLILPHCNKVLAWGFPDHALVEKAAESGKVLGRTEGMHHGQLTAVLMDPTGSTLYTGGDDCCVAVWASTKPRKAREFTLIKRLSGHEGAVSCLALSRSFSIFVSGSMDGTAIVWDLNRRVYVEELAGHGAPVRQVAINHLSGDIVSITLTSAFVWSINGELLVRADIGLRASEALLSVALSMGPVWRSDNVVVTGHADGCINFWSVTGSELELRHSASVPAPADVGEAERLARLWRSVHDTQGVLTTLGSVAPDAVGVTALALAPDDRKLYSGDVLGRVFSWSLPDGGSSDYWVKDESVKACTACALTFTLLERRHHCRQCGRIFCSACSSNKVPLQGKRGKLGRVCDGCHAAGAWSSPAASASE
ncbi:WD repeat and FYVE domain-containing protein 3 [Thecamonas trahens ATCC 50062]|uniref:WD repeat and FYVE domain-containing protein 3 n=1 Tax=Thecamonas trahens ATCC 50062 TaxID=461836 RepID=A0A0L0DVU9_THETB|nr:WD repeat and FYVE domain-containing protein 3 [Thecamonas trahens ATCC 50062]KNC56444.1 WD repeat and FYVE domain-containing protein 3 [Thecamonas trahens ATCC 50062]|eukprot:XP_013760956.1 WD repeat and FYVE domain-containing protein 3 [Thecamonas trahens ATCC 50062]